MAFGKCTAIFSTFAVTIVDLGFFIYAFVILAADRKSVQSEIFNFQFGGSTFDLLILSLLRFCLLIGAIIGVMRNHVHSIHNLQSSKRFIVYYGCFTGIYVVLKIMYFTEDSHNRIPARVWWMLGVTLFTVITTYGCWKMLASSKPRRITTKKLRINPDNDASSVESVSVCSSEGSESGSDSESEDEDDGGCKMNPVDKKEARKQSGFSTICQLIKMAKKDILYILVAFTFLVTCSVCEVFLPYYCGSVLNYIIIDKSQEKFKESMVYMALLTLLAGFSAGMRGGIFTYIFGRYSLRLQAKLFSSIMKMEIGFFDVRKTGEITSRLTSDCTKIGDGIGFNFNIFMRSIIQIIGILVFMIKLSWKLTIVMMVTLPIIAIISEIFGKQFEKVAEKVQSSLAFANASAEESISSIRTVRSFAAEEVETTRYAKRLSKTLSLRKKEGMLAAGYNWSTEVTNLVMLLLILYYGGHLVMLKDLSGGHLVTFVLYSWDMSGCWEEVGDVFTGLMEVVGSAKNVMLYINRKPLIDNNGIVAPYESMKGNIEFKDVSFAYPSREDITVLKDINFTANSGEMVALVGPSGSGKTSIVSLLEHFYEPSAGRILIDGIDVREYEHHFLHNKMSLVQQEPVLFARKLSENIIYGLQFEANDEDIEDAAKLANAHSFISAMPETYQTETGEKGVQLSGGQKQRVAIARSIIRKPTILLLDEATSALDSESEHLVQQAINKNLLGRTVIVIAHRLSTVEKADKILVIDKGRIVEEGKHHELINNDGYYAGLVKRQLVGTVDADDVEKVEVHITKTSPIPSSPSGSSSSGSSTNNSLGSRSPDSRGGGGDGDDSDGSKSPVRSRNDSLGSSVSSVSSSVSSSLRSGSKLKV